MNFTYLSTHREFKTLYDYCKEAENFVWNYPNISATSARKAMEFVVKFIYNSINGMEMRGVTVFEMVTDPAFVGYINDSIMMNSIHYIRKMGNVSVHGGNISSEEAETVLAELHFLVGEFAILIGVEVDYPKYVKPGTEAQSIKPAPTPTKSEEKKSTEPIQIEPELVAKYEKRLRETKFNTSVKRDERENKRLFMRACLREAGWAISSVPNQSLPGVASIQMMLDSGDTVDYILNGRDNRPLAIIEYCENPEELIISRKKGIAKANELEKKFGYKPIVYYTDGYRIFVIDQLGYAPRSVFQFHTLEELELLKLRANIRTDIANPEIDDNITNRGYQKEAIGACCNAFSQKRRRSLLVMATGTGKTRVSISLVDILMKANWIKNVLFLADRTSLVKQAHKNFNKLLPSVTTSIYSGDNLDRDSNARIIFSTYQTMINLINDDTREFSIGRFDLIIVDEAHRSIFKKYGSLFNYFDSLIIGLTATPRSEENKSTYEVFKLQDGEPDYAYELDQAIKDGYLVGFKVLDKTTEAMERGIPYDELSDEKKKELEEYFENPYSHYSHDDDYLMREYCVSEEWCSEDVLRDHNEIKTSRYIINIGTIDAMLNDLMKNGIKIENGDKLGKTIIFSRSHQEAERIVERFYHLYSYLGDEFCKLIDSTVENSQGLIDNFEERDNLPQVVVSVDMMDTGIDVPDILNLVFFKAVYSKIKFLQMIGRGTRLSPNIFGPEQDKSGFQIFDYYGNFKFFRFENMWSTVKKSNSPGPKLISQSQRINSYKLNIFLLLLSKKNKTQFEEFYQNEIKEYFIDRINGLCNDDIDVRLNIDFVNKYRTPQLWDNINDSDKEEITKYILPLLPAQSGPAKVKTFDTLMYVLENELFKAKLEHRHPGKISYGFYLLDSMIDEMMVELLKLKTIPEVVKCEGLIQSMRHAKYIYRNFSLEICENVRKELRELIKYIPNDKKYYIIETSDHVIDIGANGGKMPAKSYAENALEYIKKGSTILSKIRNLDELTVEEKAELDNIFKSKLGSPVEYASWANNKPLLALLRTYVGIADEAINTKFGRIINSNELDDEQLSYMNQIIQYSRENGDITLMDLQNVSPFCDIDVAELFGEKLIHIKTVVDGLHRPVM